LWQWFARPHQFAPISNNCLRTLALLLYSW
jgi:hypothetical protein